MVVIVGIAAFAAVLAPIVRGRGDDVASMEFERGPLDDHAVNAAVERYRAALRANTLCPRCLRANPAESRYCADCGKGLR